MSFPVGTKAWVSEDCFWIKGSDNYWHYNGTRRLGYPPNTLIFKQPRRDDKHEQIYRERVTVEIEKTIQQSQFEPLKIKIGLTVDVPEGDDFSTVIEEVHEVLHEDLKNLFKKHGISKKYRENI